MGDLDRFKKHGADVTKRDKSVQVKGFAELVQELKSISVAQQKSHADVTKSLNDIAKLIVMAEDNPKVDQIIDAINGLKEMLAKKDAVPKLPSDYVIDFERDRNQLMKSGIRLRSVPNKTLN